MAETTPTLDALATLSLLTTRLARLEHTILGTSAPDTSVPQRLNALEARLTALRRQDGLPGQLVRTIDTLRQTTPELFTDTEPPTDLSARATQILAHASLYTATSSRLQTLGSLKIPSATATGALYESAPAVEKLRARLERTDRDVEQLRERSERVVEFWVRSLGSADLVDDWTIRLKDVERGVRREYLRKAEDF